MPDREQGGELRPLPHTRDEHREEQRHRVGERGEDEGGGEEEHAQPQDGVGAQGPGPPREGGAREQRRHGRSGPQGGAVRGVAEQRGAEQGRAAQQGAGADTGQGGHGGRAGQGGDTQEGAESGDEVGADGGR